MTSAVISQLSELIRLKKDNLLKRWRDQVRKLPSAAHLDIPTLNDPVPVFKR